MQTSSLLLILIPAMCYGAALPTLYQGLNLASQVLDLVKAKFYFMRTAVDKLKQGINNLRNSPINEYDIASLEPQMAQLVAKLSRVVASPSMLDQLDSSETSTLIGGLASLRKILPYNPSEFNMKLNREGAYSIIVQAITEINNIVYTLVKALVPRIPGQEVVIDDTNANMGLEQRFHMQEESSPPPVYVDYAYVDEGKPDS
ncbi:hypothetical protein RB195_006168 [Necator americanus]|uniref:Uncharacterized protein n=1 Tax=Necator americanus TaxID=51031 RepID=A0ABR1BRC2_NECAM